MGYSINWTQKGVYVYLHGELDAVELGHANNRLYADERFDEINFQVYDISDADLKLSKNNLIELSALSKAATRWNPSLKQGFITNLPALSDNITKHYITHMADTQWDIQIFPSREKAENWLHIKLKRPVF